MIIKNSVKVKNYKCFTDEEQGFENIFLINILIGKNNSGKSSLIDLIEYVIEPSKDLLQIKTLNAKCIISLKISEDIIDKVAQHYIDIFQKGNSGNWKNAIREHVYSNNFLDKQITFEYFPDKSIRILSDYTHYGQYENSFTQTFISAFKEKSFRRINAERDITPEYHNGSKALDKSGSGATFNIWKYLNVEGHNQNLIKKEFLTHLNKIISPDIEFTDIITKEENSENRQGNKIEIHFENKNGSWVALSKMGSGVKTIILVLLNLILIPEIENVKRGNYVFGFEELENNLHPSLQRRLFRYITNYAEEYNAIFFITTHSNIVIDLFNSNENSQIIHVKSDGKKSIANTVSLDIHGRNILQDLDYKASDLLLANGIIWVEGPSDVIYLELFIDLYKKVNLESEKLNYCIQSLSTSIWKYAGFEDFDWNRLDDTIENKIISLANLNHNHIIVIDSDNNYEDKLPSEYENFQNGTGKNKARLLFELLNFGNQNEDKLESNYGDTKDDKLLFWITDGTMETYLKYFIKNKGIEFEKYFGYNKVGGYFEKKNKGINYSISKVELAVNIAKFTLERNVAFADFAPENFPLANKIKRLLETIKSWN